MANEKLYTAKQAAEAVLKKTHELLLIKNSINKLETLVKGETENAKKENAKPSEHHSKDQSEPAEGKGPKGEEHPKETEQAPSDDVKTQQDPQHNQKEQAEGNNELDGTTPTQVGQDGKNVPGFDEMKGHLKLAKFIGHMGAKREMKQPPAASVASAPGTIVKAETGHEKGVHMATMGEGGMSHAGNGARPFAGDKGGKPSSKENAQAKHNQVSGELKGMPKPKLPG